MSTEANRIVQKLWSTCTVLRDDGLSYGDHLEQLSVLLFLKLAHEQTQPPWNQDSPCRRATTGAPWWVRTVRPSNLNIA
jgi:type I restriction enzyme M protein